MLDQLPKAVQARFLFGARFEKPDRGDRLHPVVPIADVPLEEFLNIPGMDQDALKQLYAKAVEAVNNPPAKKPEKEKEVSAEDEPTEVIEGKTEEKTA